MGPVKKLLSVSSGFRRSFKTVGVIACCLILGLMVWMTEGCGEESQISETPVPRQQAELSEEIQSALTITVQGYLSALSGHDYYSLAEYMTNTVPVFQDQTAFEDLVIGIESTELTGMDFENVLLDDNGNYLVDVRYRLTCSGSFTELDGTSQPPGVYDRHELFTFQLIDGSYKIINIVETAAG